MTQMMLGGTKTRNEELMTNTKKKKVILCSETYIGILYCTCADSDAQGNRKEIGSSSEIQEEDEAENQDSIGQRQEEDEAEDQYNTQQIQEEDEAENQDNIEEETGKNVSGSDDDEGELGSETNEEGELGSETNDGICVGAVHSTPSPRVAHLKRRRTGKPAVSPGTPVSEREWQNDKNRRGRVKGFNFIKLLVYNVW